MRPLMTRRRCSEEAEEKESVKARQAELSTPGSVRRVVLSILDWRLRAGDMLLRGWRRRARKKLVKPLANALPHRKCPLRSAP